MFEDEYYDLKKRPLNVEWLMMDSNLLLQPANTPMTGVEFCKRLPCGEVSIPVVITSTLVDNTFNSLKCSCN